MMWGMARGAGGRGLLLHVAEAARPTEGQGAAGGVRVGCLGHLGGRPAVASPWCSVGPSLEAMRARVV